MLSFEIEFVMPTLDRDELVYLLCCSYCDHILVLRQMLQPQNYDTDCCSESGTNVLTIPMNGITQRDTKIFTWFREKKFSYIYP